MVVENSLIVHYIMLPPDAMGTISYLANADYYTLKVVPLLITFHEYLYLRIPLTGRSTRSRI